MHYSESYIYDKDQKIFIQNPINWPSQYTFKISKHGFRGGSGVLIEIKPDVRPRYRYHWLNSFDENMKWIMLFIFSSEKYPLMMREVQEMNSLYEEVADVNLFWDFSYFNHESDSTKIYLVIGN